MLTRLVPITDAEESGLMHDVLTRDQAHDICDRWQSAPEPVRIWRCDECGSVCKVDPVDWWMCAGRDEPVRGSRDCPWRVYLAIPEPA